MLKKALRKSVMPFLAFVLALIIGGILIGLTDSRVNSKISHPLEFIKALLSTVGNAYLSLFQGGM
jgi:simple sugar transport system permease protein